MIEVLFVQSKMMPDLVQNGDSHLLHQFLLAAADQFDVFLKDVDDVRELAGHFDAAIGARMPAIEAQEQLIVGEAGIAKLFAGRAIAHLDGNFLHICGERLGQFGQRQLDQFPESSFTDVVSQGTNLRKLIFSGTAQMLRRLMLAAIVICLAGCGAPSFLVTPVSSSTALREEVVQPGQGLFPAKVVIIEVEGMLINARSGGVLQARENPVSLFTQQLDKAAGDASVAAVVLRVNSPGGTVAASEAMYQQLLRFRSKTGKPVVVSGQELTASGAYYLACGADRIVVEPTTVIGSIGVIFNTFDFSGTLGKIGASSEAIKSGPFKDMGSYLKPMQPAERKVMQHIVDEFFERFKGVVREQRGLDGERLALVSDGRVFTGQEAVVLGLADRAGQLEDALDLARELGHAPGAKAVLYKRPYGYGGSIYARGDVQQPQVMQLQIVPPETFLPTGFYYLWNP